MEEMTRGTWREALGLVLSHRRLWPAALLVAVGLSESWRILFGWGPQWMGERVAGWLRGGGGFPYTAVLLLAALVSFLLLRAVGYAGEMVLVAQVGGGPPVPAFRDACRESRGSYLSLTVTLLPWDAARVVAASLPSLVVILWGKWDPHLRLLFLYLLVLLAGFLLFLAVYALLGITAILAARQVVINGKTPPEAWREGRSLFLREAVNCLLVWLQALAADVAFLALAWPLSLLLAWAGEKAAVAVSPAALSWLMRLLAYAFLAAALLTGQALVQCYKSSLWTLAFLRLGGARGRFPVPRVSPGEGGEELVHPPPAGSPPSPPGDLA